MALAIYITPSASQQAHSSSRFRAMVGETERITRFGRLRDVRRATVVIRQPPRTGRRPELSAKEREWSACSDSSYCGYLPVRRNVTGSSAAATATTQIPTTSARCFQRGYLVGPHRPGPPPSCCMPINWPSPVTSSGGPSPSSMS